MLTNNTSCAQVANEKLKEVRFRRALTYGPTVNLQPNVSTGTSRILIDRADDSKMNFVVSVDPFDEEPDQATAECGRASRLCRRDPIQRSLYGRGRDILPSECAPLRRDRANRFAARSQRVRALTP